MMQAIWKAKHWSDRDSWKILFKVFLFLFKIIFKFSCAFTGVQVTLMSLNFSKRWKKETVCKNIKSHVKISPKKKYKKKRKFFPEKVVNEV